MLIWTIILTLIIIGILIFVHELGHFLFAKLFKVKVETFSIGFGPSIFSFKKGETKYTISILPIGGYVKMAGDEPSSYSGLPDEFLSKKNYQKILIVFAGPLFNIIFGILLFFLAFKFFGVSNIKSNEIYKSEIAQIQKGDKIIQVNDKPFKGWFFLERENQYESTKLKVVRGIDTLIVNLKKGEVYKLRPKIEPVVDKVLVGYPAHNAGIRKGDKILEIDGIKIEDWSDIHSIVANKVNQEITIKYERNNQVFETKLKVRGEIVDQKGRKEGKLGIIREFETYRPDVFSSIVFSIDRTINASLLIFKVIIGLFTGETSLNVIGGPVMVGKTLGEGAQMGIQMLILITALISINLAVVNLLPIPALDGSHILIFLIESIIRKRINPKLYFAIQMTGFVILMALMFIIVIFDLYRILIP
ncbi:MAG: RIP metalloprotease RseP [candidate division WOR-3 bacterium]|nr:RIP metalloprotease RseP [candidate division WOR-3 bacterium]MCX7947802.1 RIP metalloprotease RseP [candidate division WOR-3 bacterium]MDW8150759.1 RIP metalloprotease RseP [candidate division WOR-3 bacterium]